MSACIRGCTRDVLREDGTRDHEPQPATRGLLCRRCSNRITGSLREIVELYSTMPIEPGRSTGERTNSGKRSHSPALARLDVVALTDPRTQVDHHAAGVSPRYIPDAIGGWARMFCEERGLTSNIGTLVEAVRLLTDWHDEITSMPWVDEYAQELDDCMALLRQAHGANGSRHVGNCITMLDTSPPERCGVRLYDRGDGEAIRCPRCRRYYYGNDRLRLADSREQAQGA